MRMEYKNKYDTESILTKYELSSAYEVEGAAWRADFLYKIEVV